MNNRLSSHHTSIFRRPPRTWALMAAYALGGCIAAASVFLGVIELCIALAAGLLILLAGWCPQVLKATSGAIVFLWTPTLIASMLALAGMPQFEWGGEFLAYIYCAVAVHATPVVVVIAMLSALLLGVFFPLAATVAGHCATCDYDLRGLTGNRCPECGAGFLRSELPAASKHLSDAD